MDRWFWEREGAHARLVTHHTRATLQFHVSREQKKNYPDGCYAFCRRVTERITENRDVPNGPVTTKWKKRIGTARVLRREEEEVLPFIKAS